MFDFELVELKVPSLPCADTPYDPVALGGPLVSLIGLPRTIVLITVVHAVASPEVKNNTTI